MKDFRGEPLSTGDKVAYISGGDGGRVYIEEGIVYRVTPKGCTLGYYETSKWEGDHEELVPSKFVKSARLVKL